MEKEKEEFHVRFILLPLAIAKFLIAVKVNDPDGVVDGDSGDGDIQVSRKNKEKNG